MRFAYCALLFRSAAALELRGIGGGEAQRAAGAEARDPDEAGAAADAVDRQAFPGRARKVADEVDQVALAGIFSLRQRLRGLGVERLERDLSPGGERAPRQRPARGELGRARLLAEARSMARDLVVGVARGQERRLLVAVDIDDRAVGRVQQRIL